MREYKALSIFHEPSIKNGKSGVVDVDETFVVDQFLGDQLVRNGLAAPTQESDAKPLIPGYVVAPAIPAVDPSAMKEIKPDTPAAAIATGKSKPAGPPMSVPVPVAAKK